MCGIVAIQGDFDLASCRVANAIQAHRGPDDVGEWVDPDQRLYLGHRRLAIQDLTSAGHQPMVWEADGSVVVFNGEIYNFRELREGLRGKGFSFKGGSDTEVLLALYYVHGSGMLTLLNGIFAFAIWNREQRSLFIARDAFGVKPLYIFSDCRGVACASELKALAHLIKKKEVNAEALHRYMSFLWCPGNDTLLRGVNKLEPGSYILVRNGRVEKEVVWYRPQQTQSSALIENPDIGVALIHDGLKRAVTRQLVSDAKIGAFLSGGLDSSAVVAFAAREVPELQCYTIRNAGGQGDGFADDLPYAKRVSKHLGVPLSVVDVSAADIERDLRMSVLQMDEPLIDSAPLNVWYISRVAKLAGIKVLLSGTAGDDVLAGYRRHVALRYQRLWNWMPRSCFRSFGCLAGKLDQRSSFVRRMSKLMLSGGLRGNDAIVNHFLWATQGDTRSLYSRSFLESVQSVDAIQPLGDYLGTLDRDHTDLNKALFLEQRFFLGDFNLNFTDKMSMAAGVEVRVPFLDVDFVQAAARLSDSLKVRRLTTKWVLKEAMRPYLPADVIFRGKTGFGGPVRRWVRNELDDMVREVLSVKRINDRGIFDANEVTKLVEMNRRGEVDAGFRILAMVFIELWISGYIDN